MVEVEFEENGIEDLLIEDDDELTQMTVKVNETEFVAYISQVKYGEIVKVKNAPDAVEVGRQIIKNHLFTSDKKPMSNESIDKLPAGAIVQITKGIMKISGMEKVDELRDF